MATYLRHMRLRIPVAIHNSRRISPNQPGDGHFVPLARLLRYAAAAGFAPSIRLGPPLCYLARFHPGRGPCLPWTEARKRDHHD